jgi:SSS family solute:Na+ symporter
MVNFYGAICAVIVAWVVMAVVTMFTRAKPLDDIKGLVYGLPDPDGPDANAVAVKQSWWQSPAFLGYGALAITLVLSLIYL